MDEVISRGLDKKVFILAGVTPMKSEKMMDRMKFHVPGVDIPDEVYHRLKNADDFQAESQIISFEIINSLKKMKGVHGIHITALFWESIIPSFVERCNFLPRP